MQIVRSRGLEGDHGSWDQFMKSKFPRREDRFLTPVRRSKEDLIAFFLTLQKKDDLQLLQAWVLNPSRFLARLLSKRSDHDDIPDSVLFMKRPIEFSDYSVYSRWHTLVQTTLAREDHPLDYFLSPPFEDWVITGIGRKKSRSDYSKDIDAIALCSEMVLCQDGSDSAVRVVAIDSDFKVILDDLFTPSHADLDNPSHTLPLADIQEKLLNLLSVDTIMVGHSLKIDLQENNDRYFETSIEFGRILPRRPSLDFLCESILGYEEPPSNCLQKAQAAMKLALAVVDDGAETSIPLTDESFQPSKAPYRLDLFHITRVGSHEKVLDTSLVFEYEYSGEPPKKSNRYFETRVEFGKLLPRRPSLDSLCKRYWPLCFDKIVGCDSVDSVFLAIAFSIVSCKIPLVEELVGANLFEQHSANL
ncbi:hypothetical protein Bca4012_015736 [Brassica carinata]